jgi:ABC-type multidrug transport system ATPase subunit
MVEAPGLYPYLSGRDNLRVLAGHAGAPPERVDAVLAETRLSDRAGDRARSYSTGMKQRLGVAAALLKDPELLILDEPTNGLDPAGMAEMRALIRSLARGGRTVVLSSHLMGDVEQICDRVGVIRDGVLVAEGTTEQLRGRATLRVRAEPLGEAALVLARLPEVAEVATKGTLLDLSADVAAAAGINRALVTAGIEVFEISERRASLEDAFLELTTNGGDPR